MINLLPPEIKRQVRAAKSNVLLIRYCVLSLVLSLLLFALVVVVYVLMGNSRAAAEAIVEESNTKSASYQDIQKQATEFNNNLSVAKTILDKEVKYSKIAVKIAQSIPPGIVLESLTLDAATFGKPVSLNALGKSHDDAIRLKTTLESSDTFQDVHLLSVSQAEESEGPYSTQIVINVIINPEIAKS